MHPRLSLSSPNQPVKYCAAPTVAQLFQHAAEQITIAANELWPDVPFRLSEHVPSVTGYVRRVEASGRTLFAKYSYLGCSLVSVLRGKCGDWDRIRAAQRSYVATPRSLLAREAAQLHLLHRLGRPRTHPVAAFRRGVLFTEPVAGVTLAQLLCAQPWRAGELLRRTWTELRLLHSSTIPQRFAGSVKIGERGITETFARKFTGIGADVYLNQLAAEWRDRHSEHDEIWATLRRVVTRLDHLRATIAVTPAPVLVYGDLKPEHVVFERYAIVSDRPIFIDPGMSSARVTVDSAKLVSRSILLLIGFQLRRAEDIGQGLAGFVDDLTRAFPAVMRHEWLRELLLLWLMDTINILTTYLSAPLGLPLPRHAEATLSQARNVSALLEKVSGELMIGADPQRVWRLGLAEVVGRARLAATA